RQPQCAARNPADADAGRDARLGLAPYRDADRGVRSRGAVTRHCERSEAIQDATLRMDCFVATLLAMTLWPLPREHHRLVAVEQHAVFEMVRQRTREHAPLDV